MRPWLLALLLLGSCEAAPTPALAETGNEAIASAIYQAEGGAKTHYPYGIKSVHARSVAEAHAICLRTIRHSRQRWHHAGNPGDFVVWIGRTYSPPAQNPNWVRLVRYFLAKHS